MKLSLMIIIGLVMTGCALSVPAAIEIATEAPVILSDAAKVGCAVQAVANDMGAKATSDSGKSAAAEVSKYSGFLCTW